VPAQQQIPQEDSDETVILTDINNSLTGTLAGASKRSDETFVLGGAPIHTPDSGYQNGTQQNNNVPPVPNGYTPGEPIPPANATQNNKKKKKDKQSKADKPKLNKTDQEEGSGLKIVIIVLCVLIAATAVVLVLVWMDVIKLPFLLPKTPISTEQTEVSDDEDKDDESKSDDNGEPSEEKGAGVSEEQLADADEVLNAGKEKIGSIEGIMDGMSDIQSAMNQYQSLAEEYGMSEVVSGHMADAFEAYVSAIIKHKDLLNGQELSGGIYTQVMNELNQAASYAQELADMGFTVDTSLLESEKAGFDTDYRNRIIQAFNEFTAAANWSRTEAWNLMDDTDSMFAADDLDDPIRLRYCYALAWWTQKQTEKELSEGTITAKGAAGRIASIIEATDYNLMLVDYYIQYMHTDGQNCDAVETAYNEILDKLADTQGIRIGEDVDIAHFWYFNDFGAYSVDSKNGVTTENRQWIRQRLGSVTF